MPAPTAALPRDLIRQMNTFQLAALFATLRRVGDALEAGAERERGFVRDLRTDPAEDPMLLGLQELAGANTRNLAAVAWEMEKREPDDSYERRVRIETLLSWEMASGGSLDDLRALLGPPQLLG